MALNPDVAWLVMLRFCIESLLEDIVLEELAILNMPCMLYCTLYLGSPYVINIICNLFLWKGKLYVDQGVNAAIPVRSHCAWRSQ